MAAFSFLGGWYFQIRTRRAKGTERGRRAVPRLELLEDRMTPGGLALGGGLLDIAPLLDAAAAGNLLSDPVTGHSSHRPPPATPATAGPSQGADGGAGVAPEASVPTPTGSAPAAARDTRLPDAPAFPASPDPFRTPPGIRGGGGRTDPGVQTTTYYVATNGSDSNPGTLEQPFRTLAKGVSVLGPGKTLYVRGGTYTEALRNNIPGGTSWSSPVTVAAYSGEAVTVRAPAGADAVVYLSSSQRSYIILRGLTLDAAGTATDVVKITAGSVTGASHHIRIEDGEVKNSRRHGILVTQRGAEYNEFLDLNIYDNGTSTLHHGIYLETSNNLVQGCDVYNHDGYGIHVYKGSGNNSLDAARNTVKDNRVHRNARTGIGLFTGDGNVAYNNLVYDNGYNGFSVNYGASNTKLYNNTVYSNDAYGVQLNAGTSGSVVQNNLLYLNAWDALSNYGSGTVADHNRTTDPRFVSTATADFHLRSDSPAIDAGVTVSTVTADYDGVSRPQGSAYDQGAYEYH